VTLGHFEVPDRSRRLESGDLPFAIAVAIKVRRWFHIFVLDAASTSAGGIVIAPVLQIAPGDLAEVEKAGTDAGR
jgi:hypothetical protein